MEINRLQQQANIAMTMLLRQLKEYNLKLETTKDGDFIFQDKNGNVVAVFKQELLKAWREIDGQDQQ